MWRFDLKLCFLVSAVLTPLICLMYWLYRRSKLVSGDKRFVVITGCDSGFGYEFSTRAHEWNVVVYASCLTDEGVEALREADNGRGCTVPFKMDVRSAESIKAGVAFVSAKLPPGESLWAVINNAGVIGAKIGFSFWLQAADYSDVFDVNLFGMIRVNNAFLPLILASGKGGRIVNTSSLAGRIGIPMLSPYCSSKAAVESYTASLRHELAYYGVDVVLIVPGQHTTNATNPDAFWRAFKAGYDSASPDFRASCEALISSVEALFSSMWRTRYISPLGVAFAYRDAISRHYPGRQYLVGRDAVLSRWLPVPDALLDWLFYSKTIQRVVNSEPFRSLAVAS